MIAISRVKELVAGGDHRLARLYRYDGGWVWAAAAPGCLTSNETLLVDEVYLGRVVRGPVAVHVVTADAKVLREHHFWAILYVA